jgi:hypothetical protein
MKKVSRMNSDEDTCCMQLSVMINLRFEEALKCLSAGCSILLKIYFDTQFWQFTILTVRSEGTEHHLHLNDNLA